jgi:hypothetical protein
MGTRLARVGRKCPRRSTMSAVMHGFVYHHIVKVQDSRENCENCVLVEVLAIARDLKGLAALDLAKLKAFFDRDAAMVCHNGASGSGSGKQGHRGHASRVTHLPFQPPVHLLPLPRLVQTTHYGDRDILFFPQTLLTAPCRPVLLGGYLVQAWTAGQSMACGAHGTQVIQDTGPPGRHRAISR